MCIYLCLKFLPLLTFSRHKKNNCRYMVTGKRPNYNTICRYTTEVTPFDTSPCTLGNMRNFKGYLNESFILQKFFTFTLFYLKRMCLCVWTAQTSRGLNK